MNNRRIDPKDKNLFLELKEESRVIKYLQKELNKKRDKHYKKIIKLIDKEYSFRHIGEYTYIKTPNFPWILRKYKKNYKSRNKPIRKD